MNSRPLALRLHLVALVVLLAVPGLTSSPVAAQGQDTCPVAIATAGTGAGAYGDYELVQAPGQGGSGSQVVVGTDGPDWLVGGSGHDVLCGLGGDDVLDAGSGNDHLDGGAGYDELDGGSGNDTLVNGEINDGGSGRNEIAEPELGIVPGPYLITFQPDSAGQCTGFVSVRDAPEGMITVDVHDFDTSSFALIATVSILTGDTGSGSSEIPTPIPAGTRLAVVAENGAVWGIWTSSC